MEETNSNGVFISVDLRKVSDSVECSCIQAALKVDNFGEGILKWIHVFYTDMESAVVNNGYWTNWHGSTL